MVVRVGSGGPKKPADDDDKPTTPSAQQQPGSPAPSRNPTVRDSVAVTLIDDSPTPNQGPFSDPPARPGHQSTHSLSAVIEDATRRASQRAAANTSAERERERSPFGDEHATQDV